MNWKTGLKIFLIALMVYFIVISIYLFVGGTSAVEIYEVYNELSNKQGVDNIDKKLMFIIAYAKVTGDITIAREIGMSDQEIAETIEPKVGDGDDDNGGDYKIEKDVQTLINKIKAAQGNSCSSNSECEAVLKIVFPEATINFAQSRNPTDTSLDTLSKLKSKHSTKVTVKCWTFKNWSPNSTNMEKTTVERSFQCPDTIAPLMQAMFDEIYASNDKPVIIQDIGTWVVRSNTKGTATSIHSYGCALDLNYSIDYNGYYGSKQDRSKTWWDKLPENQKKYATFYEGCTIVTIMEKYGFDWGGHWNSCCDPMHFSLLFR